MLKKLREKKVELATAIRQLAETVNGENRDFTSEERERWDKVNSEYDATNAKIEAAGRLAVLDGDAVRDDHVGVGAARGVQAGSSNDADAGFGGVRDRNGNTSGRRRRQNRIDPEIESRAISAWCAHQLGMYEIPDDVMEDVRAAGLRLEAPFYETKLLETREFREFRMQYFRAQSVGTDSEGGFTIPEGFVNALERALLAFGGMMQVSDVIRTATGNDLPWPESDDTGNTGELIAENTAQNEQDVVFAETVLQAFKYSSKLVKVSVELIQDSAFDIAAVLGSMLGERIARILNTHFTTGDGTAKPNGIVTASTLGVTAAATTAVTGDELIDLIHTVDPAYRTPGAGFMMNDTVVSAIRKLKDGNSAYLWQPSIQLGTPDRLLGWPISINQDMPAMTAALKPILFGQFRKYKIRMVAGLRVRRLVERFADADQEGFVSFQRADGDLLDAGTNPVKHLITAAV